MHQRVRNAFALACWAKYDRLVNFAHKFTRNREEAEDLAMRGLLRAIENAEQHSGIGSEIMPWLMTITRNLYLSDARRKKLVYYDPNPDKDDDHPKFYERVESGGQYHSLLLRQVNEHIERDLSDEQREALRLIVDGVTYDQAAIMLDVAVGTIKSRVTRARKALLVSLGEKTTGDDLDNRNLEIVA